MKFNCHICGKVTADIRDASIAKGSVMICTHCIEQYKKHESKSAPIPDFLAGFLKRKKS